MPGKKFENQNKFKREEGEITQYFQRHDVIDANEAKFQGEWRVTEHLRDAGLAVQTKEMTIDFRQLKTYIGSLSCPGQLSPDEKPTTNNVTMPKLDNFKIMLISVRGNSDSIP